MIIMSFMALEAAGNGTRVKVGSTKGLKLLLWNMHVRVPEICVCIMYMHMGLKLGKHRG